MFGVQGRVVAAITLRATLGRKRALLFALPPLVLILVAALLAVASPDDASWPVQLMKSFGLFVVLPLTALIIGTSVVGAEIDDGSIVHLLATPVPRGVVIAAKYAVAVALTVLFAAVPELVGGLIAAGPRFGAGLFAGAVAGSVIYSAIFVLLSVLTRRAVAVGLGYVLLWEGLLGNLVGGARLLSAGQYSLGIAAAIVRRPALDPRLGLATSLVMGVLVTAVALAVATRRLGSFALKGEPA